MDNLVDNNQNNLNINNELTSADSSKNDFDSNNENFYNDIEILSEQYKSYDLSFKIIVIGNAGVGKSCLTMQGTKKIFENNYSATIGMEFYYFNLRYKEKIIKLQIWDTCGQEVYRSLISNFFNMTSLAIIVYAINE